MKITLNLLPKEKKDQTKFKDRCRIVLKLSLIASFAVVVYSFFLVACSQVIDLQKDAVLKDIDKLNENQSFKRVKEDQNLIKDYYKMASTIEKGISNQERFLPVFDLINRIAPDGIILDEVQLDANQVVVRGEGSERQQVLDFQKALQESNLFSKVASPISNLTQEKEVEFQFNLAFKDAKKPNGT